MREIIITISNNRITASTDFAGYQGEHNATLLKFELPTELQKPDYTYKANITLPDGITATADIADMTLSLTQSLTANAGIIQVQVVITEDNELVYKSGITNLKIKQSLTPTTVIDNGSGISSMVVNDNGYLIVTLLDGKEINAGYVKGDKGEQGDPYTLTDEDKQVIASDVSTDIITDIVKKMLEHNIPAIEIPDSVTKIWDYQFQNDGELRKVVMPKTVTEIGSYAFAGCYRLTGIDISNVQSIGAYAFSNCYSLTDVLFGDSVGKIEGHAFAECRSLGGDITLPNCTSIDIYAFTYCTNLTSITLPNCTSVSTHAFSYCTDLTSITLPNCTSIGNTAFSYCINLTYVDLGDSFNCNDLNLAVSTRYSVDTLVGILNSLKDRTGQTAYTLTLGATNLAKLTDEQKAIATNKNWVLK